MIKRWLVGAALLAACGGPSTRVQTTAPSPNPEYALHEFMAAVADSNLPKMAEFWGTSKGSAAETGDPPDYPRRIEVMQIYLRGFSFRVVASVPVDATQSAQSMGVVMTRADCVKSVAVTAVRTRSGRWVIQEIDLTAVGSPAAPCAPG